MTAAAVDVDGVSKAFRLPHQRETTIKEHFLHPFRNVSYETQRALDDVSLSIEPGEFVGIIGSNGSGKSTLLKIIAGIYQPDAGSVRIEGLLSPFIELGVGFNFELNARDNIRVNGTLLGLSRRQLDDRFDNIIGFAELERFVDQRLKNYSSGMLLRLAYSIAIQVEFDILLLDEVLAVGDESFQNKCYETFRRFRADGKTIVLVTHSLGIVEEFADRAMLLERGRVGAFGDPADVVAKYLQRVAASGEVAR